MTLVKEKRIVLRRVGKIDPENIFDFIENDGYQTLEKALKEMKPQEIIEVIKDSGLRGRGGAGFPTGLKWGFVSSARNKKKFVICNADESEPGTFKDRTILENDPHSIIEAMVIAGYAVGANEGYIYIRGEYKNAQGIFKKAISQAQEAGYLGNNIKETGFDFHIHIHSGAGAYICGEETALIESIQGKRGEPRIRPPYPPTIGLFSQPTLVNNVETLANISAILTNGSNWYKSIGTEKSTGTKIFTLFGNVNRKGFLEVPLGTSLREILDSFSDGMKDGKRFKLAQTGGANGTVIPAELQDIPLDFDSFKNSGVSIGSGALLICNEDTCVVDLAKVLINFFRYEGCGKCNPCRIGNQNAYNILDRISKGLGKSDDLKNLEEICDYMYEFSFCGLGQTAGTPIKDILKHFRSEVENHIFEKKCPAGVCSFNTIPAYA